MSQIVVQDAPWKSCVKNAVVYGLEESIKRSKYPMSVDIGDLDNELTPTAVSLAQSKNGEGHDQWLTGVIVQFDLTFTIKAWTEAERYHFLDFISSQSTMHRMSKFNVENSYDSHVDKRIIPIIEELIRTYNAIDGKTHPKEKAEAYLKLLYSNPVGMRLTAGMTTNYRQLKTIYCQRAAHRLPEWREFCRCIERLPHSELITRKNVVEEI